MNDRAGRGHSRRLSSRVVRPHLTIALALVFVLVAGASIASVVDARRARADVQDLVTQADEALALAGRIERSLAQERAIVLEALTEPASAAGGALSALQRIRSALEPDLAALEARLEPEERAAWPPIRAGIEQTGVRLARSLAEIAAGDVVAAEARLDRDAASSRDIDAALGSIAARNRVEAQGLLARAYERLDRMVVVEIGTAVLLLVSVGSIFVAVRRLVAADVARVEQSNRDLDAFAGRLAHDVRNALAPLTFAAEALRVAQDPETVAIVGTQIGRSTARARRLLDGLLAFSRAQVGHERGRADLDTACAEVREEIEPLVARIDASVEWRVEPACLALSPELLHLVLANVIGNAVKFLESRDPRCVVVDGRAGEREYTLEIEDTGPGIPAEALERVFEPFYRVPGGVAGGTGIGLATVRRIVDAHRGRIGIRSTPEKGTTVRIDLPLASGAAELARFVLPTSPRKAPRGGPGDREHHAPTGKAT